MASNTAQNPSKTDQTVPLLNEPKNLFEVNQPAVEEPKKSSSSKNSRPVPARHVMVMSRSISCRVYRTHVGTTQVAMTLASAVPPPPKGKSRKSRKSRKSDARVQKRRAARKTLKVVAQLEKLTL